MVGREEVGAVEAQRVPDMEVNGGPGKAEAIRG